MPTHSGAAFEPAPFLVHVVHAVGTPDAGTTGPGIITRFAGTDSYSFAGDGSPAPESTLYQPCGLAVDTAGNVFIADGSNNRVREVITGTDVITTVAGSGQKGYSGDGGPATQATLYSPCSGAVDHAGDYYFADMANQVIREIIASSGVIITVAGTGQYGYSGDGGPATQAELHSPTGVAVDGLGNLFIVDSGNSRVREVRAVTGIITTVAGTGVAGYGGDGGPAAQAQINYPNSVVVDGGGNLFIADSRNNRIREVSAATGIITTVAGTGVSGFGGDGGSAMAASLNAPEGLAQDSAGDLFVADSSNNRVREVITGTNVITTVAGTGGYNSTGDGGLATQATLAGPIAVTIDHNGNLLIAEQGSSRVREVLAGSGIISTFAGGNAGGLATQTGLVAPENLHVDSAGNVFIADAAGEVVREIFAATGVITTFAGTGVLGYNGDGGPAAQAQLDNPTDMIPDRHGDLYITDNGNNVIREVLAGTGVITTVVGTGARGYSGDGGPATQAALSGPYGLALDQQGNLFFTDSSNSVVREVIAATGIITTVAGTGTPGYSGDGGPATQARLDSPAGLAIDTAGNLYIADQGNNTVREVAGGTGTISTIAGTGAFGYNGDGQSATKAKLDLPDAVAVDSRGNVFIADSFNSRVREVDATTGVITTVAGNGAYGDGGDGGPATQAQVDDAEGLAITANSTLLISQYGYAVVRAIGEIANRGPSGLIPWHPHHTVRLSATLGVSVDLADGHVDVSADDMSLPARGLNLTLGHTWDSSLAQAGVTTTAGAGWLDSLTPDISGAITGTITYTDGSGAVWGFPYAGPLTATSPYTAYQTPPGLPISLTVATTPTTVYTLTNILTGASRVFDAQGRLSFDADSYGNYNYLSYTSTAPMPMTATNSGGRALSFYYYPSGPSAGLLSGAQSPLNRASSGAQGQLVAYGYNAARQLAGMTWGYLSADAVTATFGYSGTQLVTLTTPGNHQWVLGYDVFGRLRSLSSPAAGVTPAYTTTFSYSPTQTQMVEGAGSTQPITTTYGLVAQGEPITITDALSHSSTAAYEPDHDVTSATDANNHTTTYSYQYVGPPGAGAVGGLGSMGLVTQTVQPAIVAYTYTNSLSPVITRYYYNATNDLTGTVGPEGDATTLYGYDGQHSVITTTQLLTATPNSFCPQAIRHRPGLALPSSTSTTSPLTPPPAASPLARPAPSQIRPADACTYTFAWRASVNSYTRYGQLSAQTDGRGVSAPQTTSQDPVPLDSPPTVTLAATASQYTRHWSYYGVGDLYQAGTPPITTISATVNGPVGSSGAVSVTYAYTGDGLLEAAIAPNGGATYDSYNHLGWRTATSQSSVPLWSGGSGTPYLLFGYDGDGHLVRQQDALGDVSTASYDPLGRTLVLTNPVNGTMLFTYTATRLASSSDPAGNVTTYGYDAVGRLVSQSDPAAPSFLTQYGYDAVGNTTAITTPLDYTQLSAATVETRTYDALNELSVDTVAGTGELTPTAAQTTYTSYDHAGNPVEGQAPNGDVTYSLYDQASRPSESDLYPAAVSGPSSPAPSASQTYHLDAADNLEEQFDFTLYDHQVSYDGANRLGQRLDCLISCVVNTPLSTVYGYDPNGNTVALTRTEPGGQVITATATYNANDWLTSQSDGQGAGTQPFSTIYGYDVMGRLRLHSLLGGSSAGVVYAALDAEGRTTALTDVITDTGQLPTTSSSAFGYTPDDLPYTATLNSGAGAVQETRQYDPDNRLTCLTAAGPSGVVTPLTDGFTYSYSPQSVITGITAQTTAAACQGSGYAPATVIAHDALGRVTATNGATWSYDGNGNLRGQVITMTGPVTTVYNYAAADGSEPAGWLPNEMISTTFGVPTGQLVQAFGYDAGGNTTAITTGAYGTQPQVTATLSYNAQGRLAGVTTSDGRSVSLGYNAQGLRASIAVTDTHPTYGGTAQFSEVLHYRGERVGQVTVLEGTASFTETFVYRQDGTPLELLYQPQGQRTQRYWYVLDGQGNVVALTNSLGAVVDQYSYDLWGGLSGLGSAGINEGVPQPLRYRGYWYDGWYDGAGDWSATSGRYISDDTRPLAWYWLSTRAYDPALKRFLQPDPSAQDGVRSYAYAHDDPIDLADPSGLAGGPIEAPLPEPGTPVQLRLPGLETELGGQRGAVPDTENWASTGVVPNTLASEAMAETVTDATAVDSLTSFNEDTAVAEAELTRGILGFVPRGKVVTVVRAGLRVVSGWKDWFQFQGLSRSELGFEQPAELEVLARANFRGYRFATDEIADQGIPGRAAASHAEAQMDYLAPGEPMASSQPLCESCVDYLRFQAMDTGVPRTVAEPKSVLIFYPDGSIVVHGPLGRYVFNPSGAIQGP